MTNPKTLRLGAGDLEGERVRAELATSVANAAVPAYARLIRDVVFTAGTRDVGHGLGRPVVGYFPVNVRGGSAVLYRTVMDEASERLQMRLTSTAGATVDLVVW